MKGDCTYAVRDEPGPNSGASGRPSCVTQPSLKGQASSHPVEMPHKDQRDGQNNAIKVIAEGDTRTTARTARHINFKKHRDHVQQHSICQRADTTDPVRSPPLGGGGKKKDTKENYALVEEERKPVGRTPRPKTARQAVLQQTRLHHLNRKRRS